jgi:hypothetical protein
MCTHTAIKTINQHRQEYQHQYSREKRPNSLVDADGESSVRITIVEDVAAGINIARIILLAVTMRKLQNRLGEVRSERPYL